MCNTPPTTPLPPKAQVPGLDLVRTDLKVVETELMEGHGDLVGMEPLPCLLKHIIGAGGKRLRPILTLLGARVSGIPKDHAVHLACAAEWLHTASLIHDDVVDDTPLRRSRPSPHVVWGNTYAVLGGDYCLALALTHVEEVGQMKAVSTLNVTVREMVRAEILQLRNRREARLSQELYFDIIRGKTASLMGWCCSCGGVGLIERAEVLNRFGTDLGLAFQITDDLLDLQAQSAQLGKTVGQDLQEGNYTLPVILAGERDPELQHRIRELTQRDREDTAEGDPGTPEDTLRDLHLAVKAPYVIQETKEMAASHASRALEHLSKLPPSEERDALEELASFTTSRTR